MSNEAARTCWRGTGGTIAPTTVVINALPAVGTATVDGVTGAITFATTSTTPLGGVSLQYTVANTNGNRSAPATVSFNVVAPEAITITRARCANPNRWDVRGTTSTGSTSVTPYNTATVPANPTATQVLGTAPVTAGAFQFQVTGAACVSPISLKTSLSTIRNNIVVQYVRSSLLCWKSKRGASRAFFCPRVEAG